MTNAFTLYRTPALIAATAFAVIAMPPAGAAAGQQGHGDLQQPRDGVPDSRPQSQDAAPRDREVIANVKQELADTEGLDGESIRVTLYDGMIALSGEVGNILAHDRAIRAATTVRGVRAIDDNLTVRPSDRPDRQIERDVETALAINPATEYWDINAVVVDGRATLDGSVESLAEKSLASRVAKGVRGVRSVQNNIVIDFPADRTDADIAHDVTELLRWNTIVDAEAIEIEVEDDVVTLSGQVDSLHEKQLAAQLAEVIGVHEVDISDLDVRWTERDGDALPRNGRELEQAVRMVLSLDPRLEAFELDIEAENGVVTLAGTVASLEARQVAGDAARGTLGVETVRNRLEVEPPEVPDSELEKRVSGALQRSPYVGDAGVEVDAVDGEVYLEGEVDSWFERYVVGDAAAHVNGVVEVHNNVAVDENFIG